MGGIRLLDCTLRDGGYINDWEFGRNNLLSVYERLVCSGVEIIEVGFINDSRPFDINRSIFPDTESIGKIFSPVTKKAPMTVGMIDYGTCCLENIQDAKDSWIEGIRVIFKKHLMKEALDFCAEVKKKGYKVFAQLVSITSYTDEDLLKVIELVNHVEPYAVSMVDTYGLLTPSDLIHYYEILDAKVKSDISIGFHAHNNIQLGYANALTFIQRKTNRNIVVDGTLHGMGKSAGNDPIELVADFMNSRMGTSYYVDQMLECIEESIIDIYKKFPWDYKTFFYLSAKNRCHPNYVSYLQDKLNLSVTDLDRLLSEIQPEDNKLLYKKEIASNLYGDYLGRIMVNDECIKKLSLELLDNEILLIGPGKNINLQNDKVQSFVAQKKPIVISINYIPDNVDADFLFVTNPARYLQMTEKLLVNKDLNLKIIATSNVTARSKKFDYVVNREPLLERDEQIIDNSFLMLLKVLKAAGVKKVSCAGLDGYSDREGNYFDPKMEYSFVKAESARMNRHIKNVVAQMRKDMKIEFVTYSHYEENED